MKKINSFIFGILVGVLITASIAWSPGINKFLLVTSSGRAITVTNPLYIQSN